MHWRRFVQLSQCEAPSRTAQPTVEAGARFQLNFLWTINKYYAFKFIFIYRRSRLHPLTCSASVCARASLSLPVVRFGCEHKFQTKTFAITKLNRHELSSAWMHRYRHLLAHFSPHSLCSLFPCSPLPSLVHLRVGSHRATATLAATDRRILFIRHG